MGPFNKLPSGAPGVGLGLHGDHHCLRESGAFRPFIAVLESTLLLKLSILFFSWCSSL